MELQKQMDEAKAKKEEQARRKKMEEDKEEAKAKNDAPKDWIRFQVIPGAEHVL